MLFIKHKHIYTDEDAKTSLKLDIRQSVGLIIKLHHLMIVAGRLIILNSCPLFYGYCSIIITDIYYFISVYVYFCVQSYFLSNRLWAETTVLTLPSLRIPLLAWVESTITDFNSDAVFSKVVRTIRLRAVLCKCC